MRPSDQAIAAQFKDEKYPGIDNWQDCNLHNGNIVYIWEAEGQICHSQGNAYAMTPDTALGCYGDPNQLQDALQTYLDPRFTSHRGHLQAYRINEDTPAAFAHCEANTCHGIGGGEQYYIPGFDERVKEGSIEKINDLNLDFKKDSLPIDQARIDANQKNIIVQPQEQSPSPTAGTTATLEGAYEGPTPNKSSELKKRIDSEKSNWASNQNAETSQLAGKLPSESVPPPQNGPPEVAGQKPLQRPLIPSNSSLEIAGTTPDKRQDFNAQPVKTNTAAESGLSNETNKAVGNSVFAGAGIS